MLAAVASIGVAASGAAQAPDIVTKVRNFGSITAPAVVSYGHNFQTNPVPASLSFTSGDRFLDEYGFTITGADFSSFTATLDFGTLFQISDLRARLIQGDITTVQLGPVSGQPLLGGWTQVQAGVGPQQVITPTTLLPGNYILEVRGVVSGDFGGAYVGVMNFGSANSVVVVPEPETYALFVAGLLAIGTTLRRRLRR